jgi:hypothetical protein
MKIAGKYKNKLIQRCCPEGKWKFVPLSNSGMVSCEHTGYICCWDGNC